MYKIKKVTEFINSQGMSVKNETQIESDEAGKIIKKYQELRDECELIEKQNLLRKFKWNITIIA